MQFTNFTAYSALFGSICAEADISSTSKILKITFLRLGYCKDQMDAYNFHV